MPGNPSRNRKGFEGTPQGIKLKRQRDLEAATVSVTLDPIAAALAEVRSALISIDGSVQAASSQATAAAIAAIDAQLAANNAASLGGYSLMQDTPVLTAGVPADIGTVVIPAVAFIPRFAVLRVWVCATTGAGDLSSAVIDVRTASGGGGVSVLPAPITLSSLTGADTVQEFVGTPAAVRYADTLHVRQTVASGNAGEVSVCVEFVPLIIPFIP